MSRSLPSRRRQLFSTPRKSASRRKRPAFELLEQRLVMSTIVVNTAADQIDPPGSSIVSLRDALALAASHAGPVTIDVPAGDYYLNTDSSYGALQIKDTSGAVTIQVTGGTALIDGVYSGSGILEVAAQTTVVASDLIIKQSYGGDGVANYGTLTMTNCRITNVTGGSGIYNKGTLHLTDVVIDNTGNIGQVSGGIYNAGTMTMTNGTLFGDTGGAIFNSGTATVTDSTLYDNDTGIDTTGSFTIGNTIVGQDAYSVYTGFPFVDVSNMDVTGAVKSLGGNLISDTVGSSGWIASDKTGTTAAPLGPQLAEVSPSPFYIPLAGSPALGSGKIGVIPTGITTDGRGLPRVVNGKVDIGAVEVQGATLIHVTPPASQTIQAIGNSPMVTLGSFTAPVGSAPFSGIVEWGDGTVTFLYPTAAGAIAAQVHIYPKPGKYTGSIALTDTAGDLSNLATFSVSFVTVPSASIVVNTTKDQIDPAGSKTVSLRDAVALADASGGATITFNPTVFATDQTISLTAANGALQLSEIFGSINIVAPAAGVTIGGPDGASTFTVDQGVTATLSGLTLLGGGSAFYTYSAVNNNGNLTISNCTITGNVGGAIQNGGTLLLEDSTISGNSVEFAGAGGINNSGPATIIDCVISDNSGQGLPPADTAGGNVTPDLGPPQPFAGGIYNDSTLNLINSTLSGNSNTGGSGAILSDNGGTTNIFDCTITANNSNQAAAVGNDQTTTLTIANTIIAGNLSTLASADVRGVFSSLGHNLIGEVDSNSSGWTKSDLTGTDADPLNPKLSALGNFGGPTESIVPFAGSPALGAGSVALIPAGVTTDQRGQPRTIDGMVDIGAVEVGKANAQPAPSTIHASDLGGTYSGKAFPATGYVAGVGGASIATPVFTYYLASDKTLSDPLAAAPSSAGSYVFVATYAGSSRYLPTETSGEFAIARAPATIHASDLGGAYNGKAFPATGYVAGVGGASIATPVFTYYLASDKTLSDPLAAAPSSAGSYVFVATYAGSSTYLPTETSGKFTIARAPATIHASDLGGAYNGKAFPATGYVAGIGGASITTPVFTYYLASDKTLSDPLAGAPSAPGSYIFLATFTGSSNYLPTSTTAPFTIVAAAP